MDLIRLRKPSRKENRIIGKALAAYGSTIFLEDNVLLVREDTKDVYGLSKELECFLHNFPGLNLRCAGIKLGEVGKRFRFSIEGTFFLAKKDRKRVYTSNKGEMLFLYGRDIFASAITKCTRDVEENDTVMVCNGRGDILGIGKSRFSWERIGHLKRTEPDRVVVENLVDRGEYLRGEKIYNAF